jgi:methylenetetrahydrofolate reductase (NADPH)
MSQLDSRRDLVSPSIFAELPGDIDISFEFFPPGDDLSAANWWRTVDRLSPFAPSFVSVTYGAGGTTTDRSLAAVQRLVAGTTIPVAAHLTCVGASKSAVDDVAASFWDTGVRHIVALRGDGGAPGTPFRPHPDGYANAAELVSGLKKVAPFEVSVAAYPDVHPDAASPQSDLDNLKRKLDAGADRALTQFFFDADTFLRFRDRAASAGIDKPIVPGVLPVTNFARTRRFASACGAGVPDWLEPIFSGLDEHPETRQLVAATVAAEFCRRLYAGGVRDFHFYTLNRAELTRAICHLLGRRLGAPRQAAA